MITPPVLIIDGEAYQLDDVGHARTDRLVDTITLLLLSRRETTTRTDVQHALCYDSVASATDVLDALIDRGLVWRAKVGRVVNYRLTPTGDLYLAEPRPSGREVVA